MNADAQAAVGRPAGRSGRAGRRGVPDARRRHPHPDSVGAHRPGTARERPRRLGWASRPRRFPSTWPSCGWPAWCAPAGRATTIFYQLENEHVRQLITDAVHNAEHAGPGVARATIAASRRSPRCGRDDHPTAPHSQTRRRTMTTHHGHTGTAGTAVAVRPHSHDSADAVDAALEGSAQGIRAVKISLVALGVTALLQGSSCCQRVRRAARRHRAQLLRRADRRPAVDRLRAGPAGRVARYTYGYGRAEDLAGLFVVAMIALSAVVAGWESIRPADRSRGRSTISAGWPPPAVIGFAGNELVAVYRIRVGRRIGSAALVADGLHARTDGLTSLAVLLGAVGVALGWPARRPDHRPGHHGGDPVRPAHRGPRRLPAPDGRRRPASSSTPTGAGCRHTRRRRRPQPADALDRPPPARGGRHRGRSRG